MTLIIPKMPFKMGAHRTTQHYVFQAGKQQKKKKKVLPVNLWNEIKSVHVAILTTS